MADGLGPGQYMARSLNISRLTAQRLSVLTSSFQNTLSDGRLILRQ